MITLKCYFILKYSKTFFTLVHELIKKIKIIIFKIVYRLAVIYFDFNKFFYKIIKNGQSEKPKGSVTRVQSSLS